MNEPSDPCARSLNSTTFAHNESKWAWNQPNASDSGHGPHDSGRHVKQADLLLVSAHLRSGLYESSQHPIDCAPGRKKTHSTTLAGSWGVTSHELRVNGAPTADKATITGVCTVLSDSDPLQVVCTVAQSGSACMKGCQYLQTTSTYCSLHGLTSLSLWRAHLKRQA